MRLRSLGCKLRSRWEKSLDCTMMKSRCLTLLEESSSSAYLHMILCKASQFQSISYLVTRQQLWMWIRDLSVLPLWTREPLASVSLKTKSKQSISLLLRPSKIFHPNCIKSGKLSTRMVSVPINLLRNLRPFHKLFSILRCLMKKWKINLSSLRKR